MPELVKRLNASAADAELKAEAEAAQGQTIVSFGVTLSEMSIADFDSDKQIKFKADVAEKLNVLPNAVDLTLSAGSVVVAVKVTVDDPAAASAVTVAVASATAAKSGLVDKETFGACEVSEVETTLPVSQKAAPAEFAPANLPGTGALAKMNSVSYEGVTISHVKHRNFA